MKTKAIKYTKDGDGNRDPSVPGKIVAVNFVDESGTSMSVPIDLLLAAIVELEEEEALPPSWAARARSG